MLGHHWPGSEGNLASDSENTPQQSVTPTPPQDKSEKPAATREVSANDKPADKPAAATPPATEDGEHGAERSDQRGDRPERGNQQQREGRGPDQGQHGQRRKHGGQPVAKNGSPTLDLVELKDMSIQNLNPVAKDMGVPTPPDSASRSSSSKFCRPRRRRAA